MRITVAKDFGQLMHEARKKAGVTQIQLAAASSLGERFIRELEKGKTSCQLEKALLVAQMLGVKFEAQLPTTGNE